MLGELEFSLIFSPSMLCHGLNNTLLSYSLLAADKIGP